MEHLEGRTSVYAALTAGQRRFHSILLRHGIHADSIAEILSAAAERNIPIRYVDERELDAHAHGATHGGVLALCGPKPRMPVEELMANIDTLRQPALLLLLEGVDDARNLGFTLRTAEALGVHAVLIKKHVWDFDAVEVARPSSGAYERLPLVQIEDVAQLERIRRQGVRLFACIAGAKRSMFDVDLRRPSMLIIGGEKRGVSGAVRGICDQFITIPTLGGATSLSLSHAAAIICAEAFRQRREFSSPRATDDGTLLDDTP